MVLAEHFKNGIKSRYSIDLQQLNEFLNLRRPHFKSKKPKNYFIKIRSAYTKGGYA